MTTERIGRRRFVAALLAITALFVTRNVRATATRDDAAAHRILVAILGDPRRIQTIGMSCLRSLPMAEASREFLVAALTAGVPAGLTIQHHLAQRIRGDFGGGNMVVVDGWLLSLTETRLYALAALTGQRGANG